MLHMNVTTEIV